MRGLPNQLVGYLHRTGDWCSKGTLTADMVWKHERGRSAGKRYLPETVGRALRSLEESGIVAVKDSGISVQYKWIPHELRAKYIPYSSRHEANKSTLFRV